MCPTRWSWVVASVVALAGLGCGGGKHKVTGVVTLDDKPIEGAIVSFVPAAPGTAQLATGTTDKDGNFSLSTQGSNDGVFPGDYKVTVTYAEGPEAPPAEGMKGAFEGLEKARRQKQKPPKYTVPAKYSSPDTSGLTQKVPASGKVTLALKSAK